MPNPVLESTRLTAEKVRWRCDPDSLGFEDTSELKPEYRILGQDDAVEALRFGLENRIQGNNVFVRGLSGFGRMALVHQVIQETAADCIETPDRCYVHNFNAPDQPRLLMLPTGRGKEFRDAMDGFAKFAERELPAYLNSDYVKSRQKQLVAQTQQKIQEIGRPFEEELQAAGLAMVPTQVGQNMVPMILPVIDSKPVQFDELQQRRLDGSVSEEEFKSILEKISSFEQKFNQLGEQVEAVQVSHQQAMQKLIVDEANAFVQSRISAIEKRFALPAVQEFLSEIHDDLIRHRLTDPNPVPDFARVYRVNLVGHHESNASCPVVSLTNPSLNNLVGRIDRELGPNGMVMHSDHLLIKAGALLEADGGYLIMEVQDVLMEPGAWQALLRTLKTGTLEFTNTDLFYWGAPQLKPEPIAIDVKVVLVGDPELYYQLDAYETRFAGLFKVLADFGDTIARDANGFDAYANVLARLVERDGLLPFSKSGVAQVIEHGARICSQQGQLTSRFGRISDIVREASFVAKKAGKTLVDSDDVCESVRRSKRRADLPARRFRRLIAERIVHVDVSGTQIGQINGLAVTSAGPLTYGFPSRITASIGPGHAGAVNIERESELSGAVHTKGFLILSGLLRYLLRLDHPMAFSAAIAFEQTYGGIDGDSASGAEFCCLLSALTSLPIRQDFAMTGAVDQKGNILPIGAASEKIEGFYDACRAVDFTGTQGVIVPATNVGELMLRADVVESVAKGEFSVHGIDHIGQALAILLDREPGEPSDGAYQKGSILALAQERAHNYWTVASRKPPE